MEGYLIQLPPCAWETKNEKRSHHAPKPHAKLLYYILGEGYLQGFVSPDDMEPVESFQLTSFQIQVDPIYSVHMFKVIAHTKDRQTRHIEEDSDSSDNDSEMEDTTNDSCVRSLLLFAGGDKLLVETWCNKILNWNRYVFSGGGMDREPSPNELAQAKANIVAAFHEQNNNGMFSTHCQLILPEYQSPSIKPPKVLETPSNIVDVTKPTEAVNSQVPWFLAWNTNSRRISSMPPS